MAWRAGAEFTMMEKSAIVRRHRWTTEGSYTTSWSPCSIVDATGKEIPWVDRDGRILKTVSDRSKPAPGQDIILPAGGPPAFQSDPVYYRYRSPSPIPDLNERIAKGEYKLPFYCDFPNMPEHERRVIYGLMIGQEGTTWLSYHNMTRAGFDPERHQLQIYEEPVKGGGFGWRRLTGGGLMIDWDLRTSLDGLYAAGDVIFGSGAATGALTSGRYAARKAAEYAARSVNLVISQAQIDAEKHRVYAPVRRQIGMEWKELDSGIAKVMQHYCGDVKSDEKLIIGLKWLDELREGEGQTLYARNPHELMRSLEVLSLIDWCQVVMHQCLARKSSSKYLNFDRLDYPEVDPPEWRKWITIKQQNGDVVIGERSIDYWGDLVSNYTKHCGL